MNTVERICEILQEKRNKFLAYEKATEALAICDADAAEHYITQRSELANEVDELTEQLGRLCDKDVNGDILFKAAGVKCDVNAVPPEYRQVFDCGQQVLDVVIRIQETEKRALQNLMTLRNEAKEKIVENQHLPKIKKYLTDLSDRPDGPGLSQQKA